MRTIIIGISYIFLAIISLPLYLVELVVRAINPMAAARFAQAFVRGVFNYCMFVSGCKKEIVGLDRIPQEGPVMYAANHRGFYDIILAYATTPKQTAFISKKEIKSFPVIAQWMYLLNCQFMDRDDIKQSLQVILSAIDLVKKGYSIYIAPEGTRNASEELLEFKEGSMKIALKGKCPIVPVCLHGTEEILENVLPWIHRGKIRIEYGQPIYPDQLDPETRKHLGQYVRAQVEEMYQKGKSSMN
ncbi:MAG: 1-acyl-sn-glycerol-3-phosphate acyltransferase [Eubacterium sp.]|nr:1-acyl-sn-glycerol-3-phosphate acyltransferase [Eubacterium sp.]